MAIGTWRGYRNLLIAARTLAGPQIGQDHDRHLQASAAERLGSLSYGPAERDAAGTPG
ncbi:MULTISPECIES: hypothetical protein [Streptomyces]|uniref:hypothetical protein n=1 Tax=Streptomyces TaxID=1883 RepID=UPI00224E01D3|nr:hypothetical protein [Streptomyces albidoflavus]WST13182.1 hypothetical protein OG721_03975 [Streptomyces microflavus]WTA93640.1 hypothetical protein OG323_33725 [Streptomyces cyaneofuscatus]MCX4438949.1 hypothetical protein [Streptomyces albidoflavus]WSD43591.1 hypothetical protein OG919_29470 [Streptomyces albidoflavus]WTB79066.1 hypothetical protein OG998_28930 [Streptomyces albidoflavus]